MKKVVVIGAGMIGSGMAIDLQNDYDVTSCDIDQKQLDKITKKNPKVKTKILDFNDIQGIKDAVKDADIVVGAVPSGFGYKTMKAVLEMGKNMVDISYYDEDPLTLDELAKKNNCIAVVDMGVSPGMPQVFCGYHHTTMDIENFEIYVGGLPVKRTWPWEYKAPFCISDVVEEYTRPSRFIENGKMVVKPALSDPELIDIEPVGTLEAFNTDGLRTLMKTIPVKNNMKEKTLRYPGHIDKIRVIRDLGLFSEKPIKIDEKTSIAPYELTKKLLFPKWTLDEDEDEFTIMNVIVEGIERDSKKKKKYTYHLFDKYDPIKKQTSMSRVTGYTNTTTVRLILNGLFKKTGVNPPEYVGMEHKCFEELLKGLEKYNIHYEKKVEEFN